MLLALAARIGSATAVVAGMLALGSWRRILLPRAGTRLFVVHNGLRWHGSCTVVTEIHRFGKTIRFRKLRLRKEDFLDWFDAMLATTDDILVTTETGHVLLLADRLVSNLEPRRPF